MMLQLDFTFSDEWNAEVAPLELRKMSEIDLRYGAALGNLIFIVNGVDCSAPWGWIPLVDLAVALQDIREELATKSPRVESFEFTESEATITFERIGDAVRITTNYVACSESVPFAEFDDAVGEFRDKVFRETALRFPSLEANEAFRSLRKRTATS